MNENILVRSPYYFSRQNTDVSALSAIIYINIPIQGTNTVIYTLTQNKNSDGYINFEISELLRDYLDINYYSLIDDSIPITIILYWKNGLNGTGGNVGFEADTKFMIDGYGYFEDGYNPTTTRGYMQSNNIIYKLADADLRIPVDRNNTSEVVFLYKGNITKSEIITSSTTNIFKYVQNTIGGADSFKDRVITDNGTYEENVCIDEFLEEYELFEVDEVRISTTDGLKIIKVITIEECLYTPIKLTFVNKWGAKQELWFFKKSIETLNVKRESFKRNTSNVNTGSYLTTTHQKQSYNVQSTKSITLNTGYVSEEYNEPMQELLQSEQVWMEIDTVVTPVNVEENSLVFKTSVNNKLVDYTLKLSYAFDTINNIR